MCQIKSILLSLPWDRRGPKNSPKKTTHVGHDLPHKGFRDKVLYRGPEEGRGSLKSLVRRRQDCVLSLLVLHVTSKVGALECLHKGCQIPCQCSGLGEEEERMKVQWRVREENGGGREEASVTMMSLESSALQKGSYSWG